MSSERHGVGNHNSSRIRRSSHSPLTGSATKKRRSSGGQSDERHRDQKINRDKTGVARDNKNSYTSATGVGAAGRDRDLRKSDIVNPSTGSIGREYLARDDKSETKTREFSRNNDRFEQRSKFGRDAGKEQNRDQWPNSTRSDVSKGLDRRSNDRGNSSSFEQRRDGARNTIRDRKGNERSLTQKDSEKDRSGFDRSPPAGFRNPKEDWNRSPIDKNRDSWDNGRNVWNRDRGISPYNRKGPVHQRSSVSNTVLSGANSVPVKMEQHQMMQRRTRSPTDGRDRNYRSRSKERLLPHQAGHRPIGSFGERDHNREDRRMGQERERSPRIDRNFRPGEDNIDRRRSSPKDENRANSDKFPGRRERDRRADSFEGRHHDKDRRKEFAGAMTSKRDRSDSREPRFGDKSFEERNLKNSRGLDRGI